MPATLKSSRSNESALMPDQDPQTPSEPSQIEIPERLPLLPIRDIVMFPYMVLPLFVGRDMSVKAIEAALAGNRIIMLAAQRSLEVENPSAQDLYTVGTVGMVMRMLKLPDDRIKILVQGLAKARIVEYVQTAPHFEARIETIPEQKPQGTSLEGEALLRTVKEQLERLVSLGKILMPDVMVVIENLARPRPAGRHGRFEPGPQGGRHAGNPGAP